MKKKIIVIILLALPSLGFCIGNAKTLAAKGHSPQSQGDFLKTQLPGIGRLFGAHAVDEGYVLIRQVSAKEGGSLMIEKYNKYFDIVESEDLNFILQPGGVRFYKSIKLENRIILITRQTDFENKQQTLTSYLYGIKNLDFKGQEELYTETFKKKKDKNIRFSIHKSPDNKNLLLSIFHKREKKEKKQVSFRIYNSDMTAVLTMDKQEFGYNQNEYEILQTELGYHNRIYFLVHITTTSIDRYEVKTINPDGLYSQQIKLENRFIRSARLDFKEDSILVVGGNYSNLRNKRLIDGSYVFYLNHENGGKKQEFTHEYTDEFIRTGWYMNTARISNPSKREGDPNFDPGWRNLKLRSIVSHEDGSFSIISEFNWQDQKSMDWIYGDLIIIRFFDDEQVIARFPKMSSYSNRFICFNMSNKLAIYTGELTLVNELGSMNSINVQESFKSDEFSGVPVGGTYLRETFLLGNPAGYNFDLIRGFFNNKEKYELHLTRF